MKNTDWDMVLWPFLILFGIWLTGIGDRIKKDEKERDPIYALGKNGFGYKVENGGFVLLVVSVVYLLLRWG